MHAPPANQLRIYWNVFAALMGFTLLTVAAAYVDMGVMNNLVAMAIAVTKGLLVMLFFMHLRNSPPLFILAVAAGFFWFAVMVLFTLSDVATRGMLGFPGT